MFQALPGEVVWLRFSRFRASHEKSSLHRTHFCSNTLQLVDGPPFVNTNTSLIGEMETRISKPEINYYLYLLHFY